MKPPNINIFIAWYEQEGVFVSWRISACDVIGCKYNSNTGCNQLSCLDFLDPNPIATKLKKLKEVIDETTCS